MPGASSLLSLQHIVQDRHYGRPDLCRWHSLWLCAPRVRNVGVWCSAALRALCLLSEPLPEEPRMSACGEAGAGVIRIGSCLCDTTITRDTSDMDGCGWIYGECITSRKCKTITTIVSGATSTTCTSRTSWTSNTINTRNLQPT